MCDPNQQSWKHNIHFVLFYKFILKLRLGVIRCPIQEPSIDALPPHCVQSSSRFVYCHAPIIAKWENEPSCN
jgi:hypothetical protein